MNDQKAHKVTILEVGENHVYYVATLDPVVGIENAKQAAREAGYIVVDQGDGGGDCVEAFAPDGEEPRHIVTVLPAEDDDEDDE
jgi:hypothetical protein